MSYIVPVQIEDTSDVAANLAHFLMANGKSIFGTWSGKMTAKDQRRVFGRYLGKGNVVINGAKETVEMVVSICFGTDWDVRESLTWAALCAACHTVTVTVSFLYRTNPGSVGRVPRIPRILPYHRFRSSRHRWPCRRRGKLQEAYRTTRREMGRTCRRIACTRRPIGSPTPTPATPTIRRPYHDIVRIHPYRNSQYARLPVPHGYRGTSRNRHHVRHHGRRYRVPHSVKRRNTTLQSHKRQASRQSHQCTSTIGRRYVERGSESRNRYLT